MSGFGHEVPGVTRMAQSGVSGSAQGDQGGHGFLGEVVGCLLVDEGFVEVFVVGRAGLDCDERALILVRFDWPENWVAHVSKVPVPVPRGRHSSQTPPEGRACSS